MDWKSKHPPIYIFLGDRWIRETDKKVFMMEKDGYRSEGEFLLYTPKNKISMKVRND